MKKLTARKIVYMGMLVALEVVLSRFLSINAWNLRIGFGFVPIALAGMLYGWIPAAIIAGVADVIGAFILPTGAFFPGFTLTSILGGINYGLLLYENQSMLRIVISAAIAQLVLELFLNTLWISVLYGTDYWPQFITRLIQCGVLFVVEIPVIKLLSMFTKRLKSSITVQ